MQKGSGITKDQEDTNKKRSQEIFKNIFQEVFLSNCGNPITFEQTSKAFQKHMGGSLTQD